MNTIEQAARRLEQLRRAGVAIAAPSESVSAANTADTSPDARQPAALAPITPTTRNDKGDSQDFAGGQATTDAASKRSKEVTLDLQRMQRAGLLVPGQPRSQLEEEFRIIKRPLLENVRSEGAMRPHRANLIMVTSAQAGEGKTQTALNLATSIAMELDHTVLLVEADVLRPSALSRIGVQASKGLLDLLTSQATELPDVLLKTNIPKLTLLPAGTASSRSTELLASDAMDRLLEELATKYTDRVVIFDTPPLLSTTESRVLASHMGQVLMVSEANRTPVDLIKRAYATIESHPLVLGVLNKYHGPKGTTAYGYYAP